jgi:hypothetical protein
MAGPRMCSPAGAVARIAGAATLTGSGGRILEPAAHRAAVERRFVQTAGPHAIRAFFTRWGSVIGAARGAITLHTGLELTEVAPGIDIDRDVLVHMEFVPIINHRRVISPDLFAPVVAALS